MVATPTYALAHLLARAESDPTFDPLLTATSTSQEYLGTLSAYNYLPSAAWALFFIIAFSTIGVVLSGLAVWRKYWIVFPTLVLGILGEIIGWSGRYWSSQNVLADTPFLMQIASLIIAPVFFSAFNYTVFGNAVRVINPNYSILSQRWFIRIFLTADVISLVLQAVGGGWAASSVGSVPDPASNLMLAGIAFQLAVMIVFVLVGVDFCVRAALDKEYRWKARRAAGASGDAYSTMEMMSVENGGGGSGTGSGSSSRHKGIGGGGGEGYNVSGTGMNMGWWLLMFGMLISSLAIIVRGCYRTAELSQGWDGELIKEQTLQNVLDGIMMIIAVLIFVPLNPGWLLPKRTTWRGVLQVGQ